MPLTFLAYVTAVLHVQHSKTQPNLLLRTWTHIIDLIMFLAHKPIYIQAQIAQPV